jgi:hypothetical protein
MIGYGFGSIASAMILVAVSAQVHAAPPKHPAGVFEGVWSVEWCDRSNPKLDCGGFNVSLVQEEDRICGDFGGALVNLRQVDEGRVVGAAVGDIAVLAVESFRNGSISLVRAERHGTLLKWRVVDQIKDGINSDIDVVAGNVELRKQEQNPNSPFSASPRACDQTIGNSKD